MTLKGNLGGVKNTEWLGLAELLKQSLLTRENKKAASRAAFKLLIQEAPEFPASAWMLELTERFGFDLANTFAGH